MIGMSTVTFCLFFAIVIQIFFSKSSGNTIGQQETGNPTQHFFGKSVERFGHLSVWEQRHKRSTLQWRNPTGRIPSGRSLGNIIPGEWTRNAIPKELAEIWICPKTTVHLVISCRCDDDCKFYRDCCYYYEQMCMQKTPSKQDEVGSITASSDNTSNPDTSAVFFATRELQTKKDRIGGDMANNVTDNPQSNVDSQTGPRKIVLDVKNQNSSAHVANDSNLDEKKSFLALHMACLSNIPTVAGIREVPEEFASFYWLVSNCPHQAQNTSLYKKCKDPDKKVESHRPVYDPVTGFSFRNIYCARCHNAGHTEPWEVRVGSLGYVRLNELFLVSYQNIISMGIELNHPRSRFLLSYQPNDRSQARKCFSDYSKNENYCNETGKWKNYDANIEELCRSYTNPVGPFAFKNLHCAVCNGAPFDIDDGCEGRFI